MPEHRLAMNCGRGHAEATRAAYESLGWQAQPLAGSHLSGASATLRPTTSGGWDRFSPFFREIPRHVQAHCVPAGVLAMPARPNTFFLAQGRCGRGRLLLFPDLVRVFRRASAIPSLDCSVRAVACARAERMESASPPRPAIRNRFLPALPVIRTVGVENPLRSMSRQESAIPLSGSTPESASPTAFASKPVPRPVTARLLFQPSRLPARPSSLPQGPFPGPATQPSNHKVDRSAFVPPGPRGPAATTCQPGSTAPAHVARRNPAENRRTSSGSHRALSARGSLSVLPERRKATDEKGNADQRPPARGKPHRDS